MSLKELGTTDTKDSGGSKMTRDLCGMAMYDREWYGIFFKNSTIIYKRITIEMSTSKHHITRKLLYHNDCCYI